VYAIDVGYNQLDWSLRKDERVRVMERMNFRYVAPADLVGPPATFAATDVSFISLRLILPPLAPLMRPGSRLVALVKPQFEAGRELVGKNGIVRDPAVHRDVLLRVISFAAEAGYELEGLTYSPITGGEGNIEFLALWRLAEAPLPLPPNADKLAGDVVREAHEALLRA
jgi:23S rRNA (cytidine1920-2'-O)/16S rRNA (cytidine1409-2'-O)-methyltransferase